MRSGSILFHTHLIILCVFTGHKISKLPLNTSVDPQALWIPDTYHLVLTFLILRKSHNLFHTSWYVTNCIHAKKYIFILTNSYISNCMFLYETYNLTSTNSYNKHTS